ncbi:MAG: 30S ribosomal protein S17 [Candidatus Pacebacteria bacterium]|nr:30S ribosomal protein S17 [Candidatus Paceibacterota bacterium]HXK32275.1 30S ribosomal protein S17 [Candidatus Paceibacterota bacterium]
MPKKQLIGNIISNKMQKTVVVRIERLKEHPKYKRRFRVHKNYKAHVEEGDFLPGDKVVIEECRPLSKDKKWKVVKKLAK